MLDRSTYERFGLPLLVYGLIGVAIFLPWSTFITNRFIVLCAAIWVLFFSHNKTFFFGQARVLILLLGAVYAIEVVGMIYTDDIRYGLHRLESKLSLIAFPLMVLSSGISSKDTDKILFAFIASTVLACLTCIAISINKIIISGKPFMALFSDSEYSNIALTEPLQRLHPTFLTLFICVAIFVITDYIRKSRKRYWLVLINLFLIFFAFQLASRAGYAALVCTLVFIGFALIGMKRKAVLIVYSVGIMAVFVFSITMIPIVKKRLVDAVLEADISKEQSNSVSYHFKTWTCSVESWLNGHVIFGHGTGDEVNTITQCYQNKHWLGYGHDAHNEFLSSLVKHGIFGFTILAVAFFYPYYLAFKFRDLRYFAFLTIILICFLSESMLRGQTGLVFFTLFNTLFLKDMLIRNNLIPDPDPALVDNIN
jgi:O-antigen ligase